MKMTVQARQSETLGSSTLFTIMKVNDYSQNNEISYM